MRRVSPARSAAARRPRRFRPHGPGGAPPRPVRPGSPARGGPGGLDYSRRQGQQLPVRHGLAGERLVALLFEQHGDHVLLVPHHDARAAGSAGHTVGRSRWGAGGHYQGCSESIRHQRVGRDVSTARPAGTASAVSGSPASSSSVLRPCSVTPYPPARWFPFV